MNTQKPFDRSALVDNIKENGIQVGDDFYMLPTGIDDEGCETFNPFSEGSAVRTAVHYRQAGGGFDIVRDAAVCRVEMVAMGPDEDGCERFRAEPVNPDLPIEQEVVYYRAADGTYTPRKLKDSCS